MLELNHIFLFTAVASALVVLLQSLRARNRRIVVAAVLVLVASALGWMLARPLSGWIAAAAWSALLLAPAYRRKRMREKSVPSHVRRRRRITLSPVVLALLLANLAMFICEIVLGGPTAARVLHRLGWLDTDYVLYAHQYWRLLTALFLHYGLLHLVVNMFALLLLGPPLEREIGGLAFAGCYLLSGIGSSLAVVLLTKFRAIAPVELVGASGCVMGVVGAWAGFLLRHRHVPLAMQRLRSVLMIVLLQIIFDLVTPRVSMSAHLGGLTVGFLLGLMLPARGQRAWSSSVFARERVTAR